MPSDILWRILMEKDDVDVAFWRLSLTCKVFRDIVSEPKFKEEVHFVRLDWRVSSLNLSCEYCKRYLRKSVYLPMINCVAFKTLKNLGSSN